jgi:hypothetical protein
MEKLKRFSLYLCILALCLFIFYLLLPPPSVPPPLPKSTKSNLSGDIAEIPNLFAYFTDLSREEVIGFYQQHYSRSRWLNLPLPSFWLNHPPEYAWVVIRDTEHSSYLEEIIHPFRESFYINGYEPANDPFVKPDQRRPTLIYEGKEYKAKITVLPVYSNPLLRIILFIGIIIVLIFLKREVFTLYGSFRHRR